MGGGGRAGRGTFKGLGVLDFQPKTLISAHNETTEECQVEVLSLPQLLDCPKSAHQLLASSWSFLGSFPAPASLCPGGFAIHAASLSLGLL